jgi:low temperature requirement protein LtrA
MTTGDDMTAVAGHETSQGQARFRHRRAPAEHGHHRVAFLELFFDLVFVFAITQLSHGLIEHPSVGGLLQTLLLAMAVWWVWIYTSWSTNWADPDKPIVRLMLIGMMLAGLFMSMAIPAAFEGFALVFALAYVVMQAGRTAFMIVVMREYDAQSALNMVRILCWFMVSGVLWIAGALLGGTWQIGLWSLAVLIEYSGPALRYPTPMLGRSNSDTWTIEPAHFAERCGLFIIIALGESVLVSGATFAKLAWTLETICAFVATFAGTVAMWAIYFNIGQERGVIAMQRSERAGVVARAYTYVHLVIVLGIIVTAVSDEFVLSHATGHIDTKTLATLIGGPLVYLAGCSAFKRATAGWFPLSHSVGMVMLAGLWFARDALAPWQMGAAASAILIIVAIWEHWSLGPDAVNSIGHPAARRKPAA